MKNNLKRIIAAGASALLLLPAIPGETITSPVVMSASAAISTGIGDGLSWELTNNDKTLTIYGSGTMLDFRSASAVPWRGKASGITKVVLPSGLENIGAYAFANCSSLKFISIPDTIEKIGVNAFYNSGLQMADFNMTNRTIDETAFLNTPFYRNKFTTEVHPNSNKGAASTMTGKQVVVNVFVNEIQAEVRNKTKIKNSDTFEIDPNTEFTFIHSNHYSSSYYRAKKEDISFNFVSSFDVNGTISSYSSFASNRVTSLDDYRYYSKINFKESELVKTGSRKYLTSTDIKNTLNTVDSALTDLENQAKDYNKTLEFITNKSDTNFFITYDAWDETLKASDPNAVFARYTSDSVKKSLINGELTSVLNNGVSFSTDKNSLLGQLNAKMSKSILKAENASTSEYTEYLKDKYDADGVVYLYHFNTGKKNVYEHYAGETIYPGKSDELSAIYDGSKNTIMHEMLHLYGAIDFYDREYNKMTGAISDKLLYKYTYSYYSNNKSNEIMMSNGSNKIGADTAYLVGLSDTILTDTFNMLNGKNYATGDVNMDGVVNTVDSTLISKYNSYKNNLTPTTALTPVQKVLGGIVTP